MQRGGDGVAGHGADRGDDEGGYGQGSFGKIQVIRDIATNTHPRLYLTLLHIPKTLSEILHTNKEEYW